MTKFTQRCKVDACARCTMPLPDRACANWPSICWRRPRPRGHRHGEKCPAPPCSARHAKPFLPCYSCAAAPVKRSRDWRPVESPRRKPWSLFRRVCGFLVCAPVYGGSDGGAKAPPVLAGGSRYANLFEPPPSIGVGCGGFSKPNHLESTMAHSSPGRISAPISLGETAHIQRHADAHHALNMAIYQRCPPQPGGSTASIPSQEASS